MVIVGRQMSRLLRGLHQQDGHEGQWHFQQEESPEDYLIKAKRLFILLLQIPKREGPKAPNATYNYRERPEALTLIQTQLLHLNNTLNITLIYNKR